MLILYYRFVPESFRFLATSGNMKGAERVILRIAVVNGTSPPDLSAMEQVFQKEVKSQNDHVYTLRDICTPNTYLKTNILFSICW